MYNSSFSLGRLELRHELLYIVLPNYQNDIDTPNYLILSLSFLIQFIPSFSFCAKLITVSLTNLYYFIKSSNMGKIEKIYNQ